MLPAHQQTEEESIAHDRHVPGCCAGCCERRQAVALNMRYEAALRMVGHLLNQHMLYHTYQPTYDGAPPQPTYAVSAVLCASA